MEYQKYEYQECFVPFCRNNTKENPNKVFVRLREDLKSEWCKQVNAVFYKFYPQYCCEDHLNLEEDLKNYQKFKAGKVEPMLKPQAKLRNINKYECTRADTHKTINVEVPSTSKVGTPKPSKRMKLEDEDNMVPSCLASTLPIKTDDGAEGHLEADNLASDGNDISDPFPRPEVIEEKPEELLRSPEVIEEKPQELLTVRCEKCNRLIYEHLFVCASCSRYEPMCVMCADQDAHAACYVLRADVTRPKSEIVGVLCAIRSELAINSFADIKMEADSPEGSVADVKDVDPLDNTDVAPPDHTAALRESQLGALTHGTIKTEDEEDSEGVQSPQPTLEIHPSQGMTHEVSKPASSNLHRKPTLNISNVVVKMEHDDIDDSMSASIKTDNIQTIQANAGTSILKRCQQNHGQNDNVKKTKLNIPQVVIPFQSLRPVDGKMLSKVSQLVHPGVKMLSKVSQLAPPGVKMISKVSQLAPPGVKMMSKVSRLAPPGVKMLSKVSQSVPPGVKMLSKSAQLVPPGFKMQSKGAPCVTPKQNPPLTIKIVQVKSETCPGTSQTVTDDEENVVNDSSQSVMCAQQSNEIVVLKHLNTPANANTLKIITFEKPK